METMENKVLDGVFLQLAKAVDGFNEDCLSTDYCMYELTDPDEGYGWPGLVIYNSDEGDVLMTYKPYETDEGSGVMLCFKAWFPLDDEELDKATYSEWRFPLPLEEPDFSYISHALDLFYEVKKEGFLGVYSEDVPGHIKEMTRLNGLKEILERKGVLSILSMQKGSFPCLWIYDGYSDEENEVFEERQQGCLIKLSYLCIREDDSEWILSVESSRNSEEKIYPAVPELKDPVLRLIIPEGEDFQDEEMYSHILEIAEGLSD